MNVGYVHTFEVPENNIDKGRLKVSVVNEENVPIKGAAVRLSYTGNPDNIIGESGTDGDGISIFNDLSNGIIIAITSISFITNAMNSLYFGGTSFNAISPVISRINIVLNQLIRPVIAHYHI